jgi:hypothetical protein
LAAKTQENRSMDVVLEIGKKRTFASALDWPGWSRSGPDEAAALRNLIGYAQRYRRAIEIADFGFTPPGDLSAFTIVERLPGNVGTDFGAPNVAPAADEAPPDQAALERLQALLKAIWQSFDATVQSAEGKALRTGPRGGRDLDKIVQHVFGAEQGYLVRLGGSLSPEEKKAEPRQGFAALRQAILNTLGPAARGELPQVGPRGGARWSARFYVRYAAWHLLDHAWEIEDRIL